MVGPNTVPSRERTSRVREMSIHDVLQSLPHLPNYGHAQPAGKLSNFLWGRRHYCIAVDTRLRLRPFISAGIDLSMSFTRHNRVKASYVDAMSESG